MARGNTVLITGAGGFIGSALAKAILAAHCERVVLLDESVNSLYELQQELPDASTPTEVVVGNVCDRQLMESIFARFQPDLVYHVAGFKHVPLAESNPIAAVRDNAVGTYVLAQVAEQYNTKLTFISTDKAVRPRSIMGASKRVAELVVSALGRAGRAKMNSIRLVNVIGSTGSVMPHFLRQIEAKQTVTITDPEATRFFLPLNEVVNDILLVSTLDESGKVAVPQVAAATRIGDLARFLLHHAGRDEKSLRITGLRPGEKLTEEMSLATETADGHIGNRLTVLRAEAPPESVVREVMTRIEKATAEYAQHDLLAAIRELAPEYTPSEEIRQAVEAEACA